MGSNYFNFTSFTLGLPICIAEIVVNYVHNKSSEICKIAVDCYKTAMKVLKQIEQRIQNYNKLLAIIIDIKTSRPYVLKN